MPHTPSKTSHQGTRHGRHPGHIPSRKGNKDASRRPHERLNRETDGAPEGKQRSQTRRPETPEQALAKLVSPSELNAALPLQRDRGIAAVEHLGDALAGTWGHIPLHCSGGVSSVSGSRTSKRRGRELTGVVRRRWEPREADGEENIPFVKSLEKRYGAVPEPKQRNSRSESDTSAAAAIVMVEISEQERKLMGALGVKHESRKHVP